MTDCYFRAGLVKPEDIFPILGHPVILFGKQVNLSSVRYTVYAKKGMKCVTCGREGHYFAVERSRYDNGGDPDKYHLNLYHVAPDGGEIMMTVDHVVPKSKGGKRTLTNLQPMCENCNVKKGNADETAGCKTS